MRKSLNVWDEPTQSGGKKRYFQLSQKVPVCFHARKQASLTNKRWLWQRSGNSAPKEGAGRLSFCNRIWGRTAAVLGEVGVQGKASGGSSDRKAPSEQPPSVTLRAAVCVQHFGVTAKVPNKFLAQQTAGKWILSSEMELCLCELLFFQCVFTQSWRLRTLKAFS